MRRRWHGLFGALGCLVTACGDGDGGKDPVPEALPSKPDAGSGRDAMVKADSGSGSGSAPDSGKGDDGFRCAPRPVAGEARLHFHHIHFNTTDPQADLDFFERFLGAGPVDFCTDAGSGEVTRATRTERGYFLYTKVEEAPDTALNTYLEHVGWIHPDASAEFARLAALDAPFYPESRAQCPEAASGMMACPVPSLPALGPFYFYLQAPSGARIEVARGPGPAAMGFGHIHVFMGVDYDFLRRVVGDALQMSEDFGMTPHVDMVNFTDETLQESALLADGPTVETRGKPIDHVAYSTTDLEAVRDRLVAADVPLTQDITERPEYGFRSLFVTTPKGIWLEIVEDSPVE